MDFTEAKEGEWQWHQLGHTQVCTSLQTDNHASNPPLSFFTGRMPFLPPNQQCKSTEVVTKYTTAQNGKEALACLLLAVASLLVQHFVAQVPRAVQPQQPLLFYHLPCTHTHTCLAALCLGLCG